MNWAHRQIFWMIGKHTFSVLLYTVFPCWIRIDRKLIWFTLKNHEIFFAFIIKQFVEIPERVRLIWLLIMWWISVINRPIKIYRACHPAWVDFDYLPNRHYLLVSPHFVSKIIINCYLWYRRLKIWKWPQSKHLSWWKSGGKKPQIQLEILNPISEKKYWCW